MLTINSLQTQAQFREIFNGGNINRDITGMSFISPSTGFVSFTSNVGYTTDSGRTYITRIVSPANTNYNGYSVNLTFGFLTAGVHAFSSSSLLLYGHYGGAPSILSSTDQGLTWKLVSHTAATGDIYNRIFDIKFPGGSTTTGFAVHHNAILKTSNGGQTWTIASSGLFNKEKLSFASTSTGFACGGYTMMKTTDGGFNWSTSTLPLPTTSSSDYNNVYFTNTNLGYLTETLKKEVWKTANGGNTWTKMNNETINPVSGNSLLFINDSTAFLTDPYAYEIYKTSDSGKIWEPCKKNSTYNYLGYGFNRLYGSGNYTWAGGAGEYMMLGINPIPTLPKAFFRIDTTNYYQAGVVKLFSLSKPVYIYKWYKNDTLISTVLNPTYTRGNYPLRDTIKLVVDNGTEKDSSIQYFIFPTPGTGPTISSFSPASGTAMQDITITGTNFSGVDNVYFGGVAARYVNVQSNTRILATVHPNGATGTVVVTKPSSPSGTMPGFTFLPKPVISSFTPLFGPVGSTVTINGALFSNVPAENIVYFGPVKAVVQSAGSTQLTVTVPNGAAYGPISVTVKTTSVQSALSFDVTSTAAAVVPLSQPVRFDMAVGIQPKNVITADFDGDGKPDIAVCNKGSNNILVYRNIGTADSIIFSAAYAIVNGVANPMRVMAVDVNGDGKQDIIISHLIDKNPYSGNKISVNLNASTPGSLSFGSMQEYNTGVNYNYFNPETLSWIDFDGDGKNDAGVASLFDQKISLFINKGSSVTNLLSRYDLSYGYPVTAFALKDIDGDGKPDVLAGTTAFFGSGFFYISLNQSQLINNAIMLAPDVEFSNGQYVSPGHISTVDIDGDGKPDIVVTDSGQNKLFIYLNQSVPGTLTLATPIEMFPGSKTYNTEFGDMNGDGKPDMVVTNRGSNNVSLYINTSTIGNISFSAPQNFNVGTGPEGLTLVDLDGDKKMEIITANNALNKLTILHWPDIRDFWVCPPYTTFTLPANINGSNYQWQADTGSGFSNIANNANYSGTTTNSLVISGAGISWTDYKFRCIADGFTGAAYRLKFGNLWTGTISNAWENPGNWSCNAVPGAGADVYINSGYVVISSNAVVYSLTVKPSATVNVTGGFSLTILH